MENLCTYTCKIYHLRVSQDMSIKNLKKCSAEEMLFCNVNYTSSFTPIVI